MEPEFSDLLKDGPNRVGGEAQETEAAYRARFIRIRRNEILATTVFYGGISVLLLMLFSGIASYLVTVWNLGGLVIFGAVVVAFGGSSAMIANWHCPRCHAYLAQATSLSMLYFPNLRIERCPHCHLRLQQGDRPVRQRT